MLDEIDEVDERVRCHESVDGCVAPREYLELAAGDARKSKVAALTTGNLLGQGHPNIGKAKRRMADNHSDISFTRGDRMFIKLETMRWHAGKKIANSTVAFTILCLARARQIGSASSTMQRQFTLLLACICSMPLIHRASQCGKDIMLHSFILRRFRRSVYVPF